MSRPPQPDRRLELTAALLALLSVCGFLALAGLRGSWSSVAGDEATFLAMTESLAVDGDLRFGPADRARLEASERPQRALILQRAEGRIAYSKPVLYPLVAVPAFVLFGPAGMVVTNALAIAAALWVFWWSVRAEPGRGGWLLTLVTFAAAGAVVPQVAWSMGDALQLALALAGATLAVGGPGGSGAGRLGPAAGGLLLGLLVGMRLPNVLLAAAVVAALFVARRPRRVLGVAGAAAAGLVLVSGLNLALAGALDPYRAERATFHPGTGYPAGPGADAVVEQFETARATQRLGVLPTVRPRLTAYSGLYFLAGRHTGVLWYFPAALLLAATALRRADRGRLMLALGAAALALFYLLWMPENYFGGASFVGNRYFLPAYALLLPAVPRPPRAPLLLGVWALAAVLFGSALASVAQERSRPFSSQSHAFAGLFRLLPYESTALAIEGRNDRYYSDEFLRFVDRNAFPDEHGFHLRAGAQPAEILLATPRPSGILRFLVRADAPEGTLVYLDWRGERRLELEPHPAGARGVFEVVAAPAWRRHPFWWTEGPWRAHALRLELELPGGAAGEADVRYLGPYRLARKFFAYEVLAAPLPERVETGAKVSLALRLANRGLRPWATEADVPIHLVHHWRRAGAGESKPTRSRFTRLPRAVERGEELGVEVVVRAPRAAGRYRLELDLAAAGVVPFERWLGAPLAAAQVEVAAPAAGAVLSSL